MYLLKVCLYVAPVLLGWFDSSSAIEKGFRGPRDCADFYTAGITSSGIYKISVPSFKSVKKVYCDMSNGGGWTVFQRRVDSVSFNRTWNKYARGFGKLRGSHWLGNNILHAMTNSSGYQLRVDTISFSGTERHDEYPQFRIGSKLEKYRLTFDSDGAPDDNGEGFSLNNGEFFSTKNRDNDKFSSHCAKDHYKGGWWYTANCGKTNLNGPYLKERKNYLGPNIFWFPLDDFYSIKFSEMKFRPMNFTSQ